MTKRSIAIICTTLLVGLLAGCGGSGSSASSSSTAASTASAPTASSSSSASSTGTSSSGAITVSAAELHARCKKVISNKKHYYLAAKRLGASGLTNRPLDLSTLAATGVFKRSVETLRHAGSDSKVEALVQELSNQEKVLMALATNNVAEAAKYGSELNAPLAEALKELATVCPGA